MVSEQVKNFSYSGLEEEESEPEPLVEARAGSASSSGLAAAGVSPAAPPEAKADLGGELLSEDLGPVSYTNATLPTNREE